MLYRHQNKHGERTILTLREQIKPELNLLIDWTNVVRDVIRTMID